MQKLFKLLKTIDEAALKFLLILFIFLIPLYPKLPLLGVQYTYIAIRADDFLILFITIAFIIQLIRKKVVLNKKFIKPVLLFWGAVFISFIWNCYIVKTMPYRQVAFLHAVRRVEYMMIFFIAASTIRNRRDFTQLLYATVVSISLVVAYALGQKFIGFPAVQTMNPAFAKGIILLLTPEARISGTFGGHYDLAAFLVMMIPVLLGVYFTKKSLDNKFADKVIVHLIAAVLVVIISFQLQVTNEWIIIAGTLVPLLLLIFAKDGIKERLVLFFVAILGINVLVFTASRISFAAYALSTPLLLLFLRKYRYFFLVIALTVLMLFTSRDLATRFSKTFQVKQILVNDKTGQVFIPQIMSSKELPAGSAYYGLSGGKVETKETAAYKKKLIAETLSNQDLSKSEKDKLLASLSADIQPASGVVADISFATRLQVEWPRAIAAFFTNPVLGTGPFSITEATDNDYLRWLGEFGLAGFTTFTYLLASLAWFIYKHARKLTKEAQPLYYGLLFGMAGLLFNAGYIDVFEASKVAYVFWCTMGLYIGFLSLSSKKEYETKV